MAFNKQNLRRIRGLYETKHLVAEQAADAKRAELHARFPEIAEIDRRLSGTGLSLMSASLLPAGEREETMKALRKQNEELNEVRNALLIAAGYPADYSDVKYECPKCADSGFVGIRMCDCMRHDLILAAYESSGIAGLLRTQSFGNFSLDFYKKKPEDLANMQKVFGICQKYAESFTTEKAPNLLLIGGTGLGKTHLSTAIAGKVIEKGYDVLYVPALTLFGDFEAEQFGSAKTERGELTDKYFEADLLILDDLGTEGINSFTISVLYNLINVRINRHLPCIFNTNFNHTELLKKYSDRITSRLFGEFDPLLFSGEDIRMQKRLQK